MAANEIYLILVKDFFNLGVAKLGFFCIFADNIYTEVYSL
jgi:hypothetical protein